jgi:transcriptional regulator with XRE-family HTH domain
MAFAQRLAALRERAGLSQRKLSGLALVETTYVSKVEAGRQMEVGLSRLIALAFVLGSKVEYLVFERGTPPSHAQIQNAIKVAEDQPEKVKEQIERALGFVPSWCRAPGSVSPSRSRTAPRARPKRSSPPPAPAPAGPSPGPVKAPRTPPAGTTPATPSRASKAPRTRRVRAAAPPVEAL